MFDFSLGELLLVVVTAVVFIGPKDMPVVIRVIAKVFHQMAATGREVRAAFHQLAQEAGLQEARRGVRTIIGQDGKAYPAYDIEDFLTPLQSSKKAESDEQ